MPRGGLNISSCLLFSIANIRMLLCQVTLNVIILNELQFGRASDIDFSPVNTEAFSEDQ